MSISRRNFIRFGSQLGLAAGASALWSSKANAMALDAVSSGYKAIVLVSMIGGNDCNSLLVPGTASAYAAVQAQRSNLAINFASYNQIYDPDSASVFALHPALKNVASMYAQKRALVVANIGSLPRPATKADVLQNPGVFPGASLSHAVGVQQWESAQASSIVNTGWGGRIADRMAGESGALPPVLSTSGRNIFTIGETVQAVTIQQGGAFTALPADLTAHILQDASRSASSGNVYVANAAILRKTAMESQALLDATANTVALKTTFPNTTFGGGMQRIAQILGGHGSLGASRQMFFVAQGAYDTHSNQLANQAASLTDLDNGLAAFFRALDELGLSDQVLVCTHSDFGRTLLSNSSGGTDHGWGGHQLILGGGIRGGRIIGKLPELVIGGPDDYTNNGGWVPTLAVTQMTAAIGGWMGLNTAQVSDVFPDLKNFPQGAIKL